jgi:hypothetical protein
MYITASGEKRVPRWIPGDCFRHLATSCRATGLATLRSCRPASLRRWRTFAFAVSVVCSARSRSTDRARWKPARCRSGEGLSRALASRAWRSSGRPSGTSALVAKRKRGSRRRRPILDRSIHAEAEATGAGLAGKKQQRPSTERTISTCPVVGPSSSLKAPGSPTRLRSCGCSRREAVVRRPSAGGRISEAGTEVAAQGLLSGVARAGAPRTSPSRCGGERCGVR